MPEPTIAILGASPDRLKFGNKAVRAYRQKGYDVYPVNPKGGEIEGLVASRSLAEVPAAHLNRISVYLPPAVLLNVLDDIAAKGCDELWLNPGCDTPEVIAKAQQLGLNVVAACSIVAIGISPSELPG
ncbi:MAG TPA: CoA-binding protein [Pirellulales bacterium]|jgi:hypothetical protein